ncbi:hypothetical protein E2C01_027307 [Portunus trituberculatus]|uniref:Uncharacterized protein n=1 Tax=Portunus trituberculatus TaxID=210409 RepID=A0A5B7EKT3_PORTR|nr:hypothetical protein [Portunus trituberculatus]
MTHYLASFLYLSTVNQSKNERITPIALDTSLTFSASWTSLPRLIASPQRPSQPSRAPEMARADVVSQVTHQRELAIPFDAKSNVIRL